MLFVSLPPTMKGRARGARISLRFHVSVAQKRAITSCCVLTAPLTLTKRGLDMTIFMDRLLLLVHTLLALSKEAPDSVFRAKCEKHLNDEWFQRPIILHCCMAPSVILNNKMVSSISLSDNGSTLSFVSAQFIKNKRCLSWVLGEVICKP